MSQTSKPQTIQEKLTELSQLVSWFQDPEFTLDEALTKFKEAEALAETIEKELTGLKNEINVIKKRFDGGE